jgi:curved DNA-binding protein
MAVEYQDYYQILGVDRDASQGDIQKAFRKLARKYHPDVSKERNASDKFKKINEAYEVLKDPEKRKRYDALGRNWQQGQEFRPPPGWEKQFFDFGGERAGGASFHFEGGGGDFSSFFEQIFGSMGMGGGFSGFQRGPQTGTSQEADIQVALSDIYTGATKYITLQESGPGSAAAQKRLQVKIPAGTKDGSSIRLSGQGGAGSAGGKSGDLFLRVKVIPDANFKVDDFDLSSTMRVPAWDLVLGSEASLSLPDGKNVTLKIPKGSQNGQRMRLKGMGLPKKGGERGDLYVQLSVLLPESVTAEDERLWQELRDSVGSKGRNRGRQ